MDEKQTFGRIKLYTSLEPTKENMPKIINSVYQNMQKNWNDCAYLYNYYKGNQPILEREKATASEINNKVVINWANVATRMCSSYFMGVGVNYSAKDIKNQDKIFEIEKELDLESKVASDIETAMYCSICGIGYRYTNKNTDEDDENMLDIFPLSPLNTFEVLSTKVGQKVLLTGTATVTLDENGNIEKYNYLIYTNKKVFELEGTATGSVDEGAKVAERLHGLNSNPIQTFYNNPFLLGDFEIALTLLDKINLLGSNSMDDIEQIVQSILVFFGIDKEQREAMETELKTGSIVMFGAENGVKQDAKYLTAALDPATVNDLREYLTETMKSIIGIPDRKTRSGGGGDTGQAVKLRDGWGDMDIVARIKDPLWKKAERKSLKIILEVLKIKMKSKDVEIKIPRNKLDNAQSKAQTGQILYEMNMDKSDILETMDMNNDKEATKKRWEENEKKAKEEKAEEESKKTETAIEIDTEKTKKLTTRENG